MTGRYAEIREGGSIRCSLCPHGCVITEGKAGICRIRKNIGGSLQIPFYGVLSALNLDPIEKKPLFHFHPGMNILSAGFFGCNFRCPFCQNYNISQEAVSRSKGVSPAKIVQAAVDQDSFGIAYTYSEPLVHFEYIMDCAKLAHEKGLKNVIVSNGFLNLDPAAELLEHIDAANIDLKSFDHEFYRKELGGSLEPVLEFIRFAASRTHLEVTTLVIPTKNDSEEEIEAIARFLASLHPAIPLHLSCYYPTYRYTIPATPPETVLRLRKVAQRHLYFVYPGNVGLHETNTHCPQCNALLISRTGYRTSIHGLKDGICTTCGFDPGIPGT